MNTTPEARLLELYDRVAEAPDAIERLRKFVLDLAVRGKLVEQNPEDEPVEELLERITAEKARLVKAGETKARKPSTRQRDEPLDFQLPSGWTLSDLGDISLKITDGAHKTPTYVEHGVPFVSVKDFSGGKLRLGNTRFIPEAEHKTLYKRCDPRRGDILLGRIGTLGKAVLVDTDVEFSLFVSVGLIRFDHNNLQPEFFRLLLNSPLVEEEFNRIKVGGGTHTNKLNLGDLHTVAIPLPPLPEQHRIVAKVDELTALLDRLETTRTQRETTRDRLATASLTRLTAPDTTEKDFAGHARFALDNLDQLTSRPDQIKVLRQTILNLAVRGKLVEQDPADEPASVLLKQIAVDRNNLLTTGEIKKQKPILPVNQDDTPYDVPDSWEWARFNEIAAIQSNLVDPKRYPEMPHIAPDNIEGWTARLLSYSNVKEAGVFSGKHLFAAGSILYSKIRPNLAKVAIVDFKGLCSADMYPIRSLIFREFLVTFMITGAFVNQAVSEDNRVAMPKINQLSLSNLLVPIPPLAEQHRIVEKVDSLMELCNKLEADTTAAVSNRARLLDLLLRNSLAQDAQGREAA